MPTPAPTDPARRVSVGRTARAHGVRGLLKIHTFDPEAPSLRPGVVLYFQDAQGVVVRTSTVARVQRLPPSAALLTLEPPLTREEAEALRGHDVLVDATALPALEQDEVWAYELPGWRVQDPTGRDLGTVAELVSGVAHDLLAVDTGHGVFHVPYVAALVKHVDRAQRTVVVELPAGMLDDAELVQAPRRR